MMAITEDPPKSKRCCGPAGCGLDILTADSVQQRFCIGSACMAWRWHREKPSKAAFVSAVRKHREDTGDGFIASKAYVEAHPDLVEEPPSLIGYCGLAGRPEDT